MQNACLLQNERGSDGSGNNHMTSTNPASGHPADGLIKLQEEALRHGDDEAPGYSGRDGIGMLTVTADHCKLAVSQSMAVLDGP